MVIHDASKCSPGKQDNISCFSYDSLKIIANKINQHFGKIPKNNFHKIIIGNKQQKQKLWNSIVKSMKGVSPCKTEVCWLKSEILNNLPAKMRKQLQKGFRPIAPTSWDTNKNEWLSTVDIANVLEQYEDTHEKFKLYGPTPIDFHLKNHDGKCMVDDLCAIDLERDIKDGITNIGIVFNTDPHNKGGQHWISLYVDLFDSNCLLGDKNIENIKDGNNCSGLYYFDSQGLKPPNNIVKLMDNLSIQGEKCSHNIKFQKLYNDIQHQRKNTECGIYCIHFITTMLNGMRFKDYIETVRNDEEMEKFRDVFFIKNTAML